jgi:hypothetical protein
MIVFGILTSGLAKDRVRRAEIVLSLGFTGGESKIVLKRQLKK